MKPESQTAAKGVTCSFLQTRSCLFLSSKVVLTPPGFGRKGRDLCGQGGLQQPAEEAHHEVAEGEVAGLGQQGGEAPAVQGDL